MVTRQVPPQRCVHWQARTVKCFFSICTYQHKRRALSSSLIRTLGFLTSTPSSCFKCQVPSLHS